MSWTPDHQGYKDRQLHKPTCEGKFPSTCACKVTEFWVLNEDVQELEPSKVGKWMYFPNFEATSVNLDELWSIFSEHTNDGYLGWGTKLSLKNKEKPALMCYTKDHLDKTDTERVSDALYSLLADIGIQPRDISLKYKTDEATLKGLYSALDVDKRALQKGLAISQIVDKRAV
jgi:hypothetical protein